MLAEWTQSGFWVGNVQMCNDVYAIWLTMCCMSLKPSQGQLRAVLYLVLLQEQFLSQRMVILIMAFACNWSSGHLLSHDVIAS